MVAGGAVVRGEIMRKLTIAAALLASAAFGSTAQAAITVYTTQEAFLAATTAAGTDAFENLSITTPTESPITRTAGSYGYTATTSNLSPDGSTGFYGAGSTADRWLSTNYALDTVTFGSFTGSVSALGGLFFTSNIAGAYAPGAVTLTATDSLGATVTQTIIASTTSSFLGFVSNGSMSNVTLASIQPAGSSIWPTANNLTLARAAAAPAVPEPATWAMMLVGFGMIGATARYRRRTTKIAYA